MFSGNNRNSWKNPSKLGKKYLLDGITDKGVEPSTQNLFTREIVIGKKNTHSNKISVGSVQKIEEFAAPNKESRQLQILLNALLNNEEVTFKIKKGKKIVATYGGKKYKLHHILQEVDWSDIHFNDSDFEHYQDYIFSKERKFKPTLPKRIDVMKDDEKGKEKEKVLNAPQFTCRCMETDKEPDVTSFFVDKPNLYSAYVVYNDELYYAKNTDEHFEKIALTAEQLNEVLNSKTLVNDRLIYQIISITQHENARKDKMQHWKNWYYSRARKYHAAHPDSRIHEWHFSEMLGMNIYTTQFYIHANMLLRGNTDLLTKPMLPSDIMNEIVKSMKTDAGPTPIIKEILLTSAMAMHGMHKHLEIKRATVRMDEFTKELYESKINKFNILAVSLNRKLKKEDVKYFKKLSYKNGGVPVLIKQNDQYFMYGFSENKWALKHLDATSITAIPKFVFSADPTLFFMDSIDDAIYEEIKRLNGHEKLFTEKSFVSSAYSKSTYITKKGLEAKKENKDPALALYVDVEGADVTAISANPHEKEFNIRPGKVKYEAKVTIDGVKTIVGRQVQRLKDKPRYEAVKKIKRRDAVSSLKKLSKEKVIATNENVINHDEKVQDLLKKTPEEQYQNNLKAWTAFLDPHAATTHGEDYAKRQEVTRRILALLDYLGLGFEDLSHGGRIRISCNQMQALFDSLINPSVLQPRAAASHKIIFKRGQFLEKSLEGGVKALLYARDYFFAFINEEHWGMNIGISADAKAMPANGSYGHLYLNKHFHANDPLGALLIGLEGSEPGKKNQFGQLHGAAANKNLLSATGAAKNDKNSHAPFHHINNVQKALEYVENNYKNIEKKWQPSLDQENERLKYNAINQKKSAVTHKQILPSSFQYDKVVTTDNYETALAEKDKLLTTKNEEPVTLQAGHDTAAPVVLSDKQYQVIPAQYGEIKSVTIHSKNKNVFKSNIFFQDPSAAKNNFKKDRQYKIKSFAEHLASPFKTQTTIPSAECMEWACNNVGLFLANEESYKKILKEGIRCYNMSREQIEAIQIYCRFYSKHNSLPVIRCHSSFHFEERTLDKQVILYESLLYSKEKLMMPSTFKPSHLGG